jgi:branched-chain amino acid transport system substrate-binding protein
MKHLFAAGFAAIATCATLAVTPSQAEEPTVGIVAAFSGPYAAWGDMYKREIDLWMHQNDGKHGYPKIHLILRDAPGISNVARTKQVVQEFIVRDNAAVVGGGEFTPEALAVAPLVTQAKIPYVIFNGATSFITDHSPYLVLVGYTIWQPTVPIAEYAATHGCKRVTMIVADYAPGDDTIKAFSYGFKKDGGTVGDVIKVPIGTTDFSSYMQHIKESHPQCVFPFMPGGPMAVGFIKAYTDQGFKQQGITMYDAGSLAENYLDPIGDSAIGVISAAFYSTYLDIPSNQAYIAALKKHDPDVMRQQELTFGYDGMHVIFHMLKATGGKRDAKKAIASLDGWQWMSPRGPVSIDPKTRDIVQNVYIRKVVKENGVLFNKAFETIPHVHDQWHELHGKN